MNIIKNIHKLTELYPDLDTAKLEAGALQHQRYSNIAFKVIKVNENQLVIKVTQGRTLANNYAERKVLETRAKELFKPFFPKHSLHIQAVPYSQPPVDLVSSEWIQERLRTHHVTLKKFTADTGLDGSWLSGCINGHRELSQVTKTMFYYYFEALSRNE